MATILVGHANQRDGVAELRTWEHVDAICRERFNQGAPLDPASYQEFLQAAQGFLAACGLRVSVAPTPEGMRAAMADRAAPESSPPPKRSSSLALAVGIVGSIALVVAVAVWRLVVAR